MTDRMESLRGYALPPGSYSLPRGKGHRENDNGAGVELCAWAVAEIEQRGIEHVRDVLLIADLRMEIERLREEVKGLELENEGLEFDLKYPGDEA